MLPTVQKILYTTDLSPNSAFAFRFAITTARQHGARIIILHVLERIPASTKALLGAYLREDELKAIDERKRNQLTDEIRQRLDRVCEAECRYDPELLQRVERIEVCEGYPSEEILRRADQYACDLIIMGSHGKGLLEHTFVGSVTHQVLRRTHKPVTVIPLPKGETESRAADLPHV
jgi:nucleotide-binding universal stress UspA family protein